MPQKRRHPPWYGSEWKLAFERTKRPISTYYSTVAVKRQTLGKKNLSLVKWNKSFFHLLKIENSPNDTNQIST